MSNAICRACGGVTPNHKPTIFDPDGLSHPGHKVAGQAAADSQQGEDSSRLPQPSPTDNSISKKPRPCLGYTSAQRISNGVAMCMGCEQPVKDHPIAGHTMSPEQVSDLPSEDSKPPQQPLGGAKGRPTDNKADDILEAVENNGHHSAYPGSNLEPTLSITEAKASLYQATLDLIGQDEPVKKIEGLAVFKIKLIRNQLRAEQRTAAARYYGQEG